MLEKEHFPLIAGKAEWTANSYHTIAAVEEEDEILFYREQREFTDEGPVSIVFGPFTTVADALFGVNPY